MKRSKLLLYGLLVLTMGSYNQCAPKDWKYMARDYVIRKDLSSKFVLSGTNAKTQFLILTSERINNSLGITEQLDGKWFGERDPKVTLKSVRVESCEIDINVLPGNQASLLYVEGTVEVAGSNKPLFSKNKPIPLNNVVLYGLTELLNANAVADVQKAIDDNLRNLNKTLNISFKLTPDPSNKVAQAEITLKLVVTSVYDVCQLMPPGSGDRDCQ